METAPWNRGAIYEPSLWSENPGEFNTRVEGAVVFDPMCGSGQTLIAADVLGRRWVGMDCSAEYCDLTRERLAWYRLNTRLNNC